MLKITDTSDYMGMTSLKKFNCPNCEAEIVFRMTPQAVCYKCKKPLMDAIALLRTSTARVLYHRNCLI